MNYSAIHCVTVLFNYSAIQSAIQLQCYSKCTCFVSNVHDKEVCSVINFDRYHTIAKHFCTIAQLQTASIKAFLVLQEKLENTQVLYYYSRLIKHFSQSVALQYSVYNHYAISIIILLWQRLHLSR